MSQITLSDVAVEFGATTVFRDVSFTVARGQRWGVVGRNGSGKTTFLELLAGDLAPARGTLVGPGELRITLLDQHREFPEATTVWDAAASPFAELRELETSLAHQAEALAEAGDHPPPEILERYDRDLERFAREGGYEMEARVDGILQGLGFDPDAARTRPVSQLSGGEAGRVGLARQLAAPTNFLLLDEPTNHLDVESVEALEDALSGFPGTGPAREPRPGAPPGAGHPGLVPGGPPNPRPSGDLRRMGGGPPEGRRGAGPPHRPGGGGP